MTNNFGKIPKELKSYNQWVCWRYEERHNKKPTKVPYDPVTARTASVTDPNSWRNFTTVTNALNMLPGTYDGIGFVLTGQDPYTVLDLDYSEDEAIRDRQLKVYNAFNSYTEYSPSGKGLHIIVQGFIPSGRRRSSVEIYHDERYITMTGNVLNDKPIHKHQTLLDVIYSEMSQGAKGIYDVESAEEKETDAEVIEKALSAVNGDKFKELLEGRWQGLYPSQSEADISFINIITFYTQNVNQIIRIFWNTPLGSRVKAQRLDYVNSMIYRAFDRMLPPVDLIQVRKARESIKEHVDGGTSAMCTDSSFDSDTLAKLRKLWEPKPLQPHRGLMGQMADYFYKASPRQIPETAIMGAMGLFAGITGKAYNVSGTGLNLYLILLANTGIGKESMAGGISKLMNKVVNGNEAGIAVPAAQNFIGPSDYSSGQALLKTLSNKNTTSFVSLVGEFGLKMQQLAHPRAGSNELLLKKYLLDLYNKSGDKNVVEMVAYSKKENSVARIFSPAVTILGETTPSTFYSAIDESLILDGLLPRFTFIEYKGLRPRLNKKFVDVEVPVELSTGTAELCQQVLNCINNDAVNNVGFTKEADEYLDHIEELTTDLINNCTNDALRDLWNRAHLKTMKKAALEAVSMNLYHPVIDLQAAQTAFNIIMSDINTIHARFSRGEIGKNREENQQAKLMLDTCIKYYATEYVRLRGYGVPEKLHKANIIPYSYLARKFATNSVFTDDQRRAVRTIKDTIQVMLDSGDLQEIGKGQLIRDYNYSGRGFVLPNPEISLSTLH